MIRVEYLDFNNRINKRSIISEVSQAIFGDKSNSGFIEEFIPVQAQVPEPKTLNFENYLLRGPKCLWAIYYGFEVVGFILISDLPHVNSIGFGINQKYAGKGIVGAAWEEIKGNSCIVYPLYANTSKRNSPAIKLLNKIGFKDLNEDFDFFGELSSSYIKNI